MIEDKVSIFGGTVNRVGAICDEAGLPGYAKNQIVDWLYKKHAVKIDDMTNLSAKSRALLARDYDIVVPAPLKEWRSIDGTKKYLFRTAGGALIESALIPDGDRATLCLSTQAGCRRACKFCMTGKQGLQEDITAGEILNQYRSLPERDEISNIVYMGMGEPLDNIGPVLDSLEVFTSAYGYGLSPRRITVSTVGILPELVTLIDSTECSIAISLHSPFEHERKRIMPVESTHPLSRILDIIRSNPFGRQRRVSFEYILFDGVNDSRKHADELVRILHGIRCRVNLIPFNSNPEIIYRPTPVAGVESFQGWLRAKGMVATIRRSRGRDIEAACGLLSTKEELRKDRDEDQ